VISRCPGWTLAATYIGQGASHARAIRFPVFAIIADGHGPLKALLVSVVVASDTLLCAVNGDVGWCIPVTA
jgi:hypothetical protein